MLCQALLACPMRKSVEILERKIPDKVADGDRVPISFDVGDVELRTAFRRLCEDRGTDMAAALLEFVKQQVAENSHEKPQLSKEDRIVAAVRKLLRQDPEKEDIQYRLTNLDLAIRRYLR